MFLKRSEMFLRDRVEPYKIFQLKILKRKGIEKIANRKMRVRLDI